MRTLRGRLSWFAGAWLVCQLGVLTLTPVALCVATASASPAPVCTCAHGDGATCPMHHPEAASNTCSCRSTTDGPIAAMTAWLGPSAVLPHLHAGIEPAIGRRFSHRFAPLLSDPSRIPDAPPPRA